MLLIDGYNLMHAAGLMKAFGPGGLEKARRALIGVLAGSLGEEARNTTIVFDGRGGDPLRASIDPGPRHEMTVEFASDTDGADGRIEQLIATSSAPKQLAVVSSDHRIRGAARRRGATAIDSESFWEKRVKRRVSASKKVPHDPDKTHRRARSDNEHWLKEFQGLISDDDLRELSGPFGDEFDELK